MKKIILMHINKNLAKHEKENWERLTACGVAVLQYQFETHDVFADDYTIYEKLMPFSYGSLAMHPRFKGKCWNFITDHPTIFRPYMNDKTLFWIVGSEPNLLLSKMTPTEQPYLAGVTYRLVTEEKRAPKGKGAP